MIGFDNIELLRKVEWGATYLWDIYFPDIKTEPFNGWFPAINVSEPLIDPVTESIEFSTMRVSFPKTTGSLEMSITFYDDVNRTLEKWILDWYDLIYNDYQHVTPLWDCVKDVHVLRLNRQKEPVAETVYSVFPNGRIDIESGSSPTARQINLRLSVTGYRRLSVRSKTQ